ncbi:hypothetical protein EPH_0006450 [Eimeria praecox]|uniref:Uncharacterized protein n=1 Tax=Eimeria praecox TaxID=51316 RepID=U6G930_9EIME|nr:hypothetical protein EPH_0006450 [Eimeria praecox]
MSGSSVREPGHTIRRLSDSKDASQGDTALSQLIEECVAMEEDLGQTVPQGSSSHHALDAAEHVARIAFALSQEALAFETEKQQAQQATHPTFSPILPYPASAGMNYHDQHLEEATGMAGQQAAELDEQLLLSGLTTAEHKPGSVPPEPLSSSALPVGGALQPVLLENQLVSESPSPFHWFEQGGVSGVQA